MKKHSIISIDNVTYSVNTNVEQESLARRELTRNNVFFHKELAKTLTNYFTNAHKLAVACEDSTIEANLIMNSLTESEFKNLVDDIQKILNVITYHSPFDVTITIRALENALDEDKTNYKIIERIIEGRADKQKTLYEFKKKINLASMMAEIEESLFDPSDDEFDELDGFGEPHSLRDTIKNPVIREEDKDAIVKILKEDGLKGSGSHKKEKLASFIDCDFKKTPYIDDYSEEELYKYFSEQLAAEHFPKKIQRIIIAELIQYKKTGKCTPIIFDGPKGCGKTEACTRIAKMIGLPFNKIDAPGAASSRGLRGVSSTYSNSDCGEIAETMIKYKCANPILIIDEIDKAQKATGNACDLNSELLSVCDGNRCINDMFLDVTIDTSHCIILMTANDIERISPFLRDRCRIIHYPELEYDRVEAIITSHSEKNFIACNYNERVDYNKSAIKSAIKQIWDNGYRSFRPFVQFVECVQRNAYMDALENGKRVKISSRHIKEAMEDYGPVVPKTQQKRRIGFDVER